MVKTENCQAEQLWEAQLQFDNTSPEWIHSISQINNINNKFGYKRSCGSEGIFWKKPGHMGRHSNNSIPHPHPPPTTLTIIKAPGLYFLLATLTQTTRTETFPAFGKTEPVT